MYAIKPKTLTWSADPQKRDQQHFIAQATLFFKGQKLIRLQLRKKRKKEKRKKCVPGDDLRSTNHESCLQDSGFCTEDTDCCLSGLTARQHTDFMLQQASLLHAIIGVLELSESSLSAHIRRIAWHQRRFLSARCGPSMRAHLSSVCSVACFRPRGFIQNAFRVQLLCSNDRVRFWSEMNVRCPWCGSSMLGSRLDVHNKWNKNNSLICVWSSSSSSSSSSAAAALLLLLLLLLL